MLRRGFSKIFEFDWKLGIFLILLFGVIRFIIVLNASITGDFKFVSVIFVVMALTPFLLLNKSGLKKIGLVKPLHYQWIPVSILCGAAFCAVVYLTGNFFFQLTQSNWFVYIGGTYPLDFSSVTADDRLIYFIIFALIGMTFSPVGEELMYRGMIHQSFVKRFGERGASLIESAAFGVTHLAHFGLVYQAGKWSILFLPALLWVILMFCAGLVFNFCKNKTGSIAGAVISHAGFNLAMTYFIFYQLF